MQKKINVHNEEFAYDDGMPFHIIEIVLKPGIDLNLVDRLMHHWHSEVEICCCLYPGSHHFIDGNEYLSSPGKLMIVNSGSIHHFLIEPFTEEEPRRIAILLLVQKEYLQRKFPGISELRFTEEGWADSELRELMESLTRYAINDDGISDKNPAPIVVNASAERRYSHQMEELAPWQQADMEGLVLQVLARLVRDRTDIGMRKTASEHSAGSRSKMKDIISYIEENYQEPLTQEQVADKFHYSASYFSSFFKKNMQVTFSRYLADYRAKKARFDLLETNESIYAVALRNGFSDSRRFIMAFRELYGLTPLQYRKASKNKENKETGKEST